MPRHRHPATRLTTQAMELGLAVPEVIAQRLLRMALAGSSPSASDREEFLRMSGEKVSAFYESWNGIFLAMYRANLHWFLSAPTWSSVWRGQGHRAVSATLQRAALDILSSGVAPVHRRAVSNSKRLRPYRKGP
jgi:hypothetical protein